jgi:hypothetical protein
MLRADRSRKSQLSGASDRNVRRIRQEIAEKCVRVVYDRDKRIGEIPPNLKHYNRAPQSARPWVT